MEARCLRDPEKAHLLLDDHATYPLPVTGSRACIAYAADALHHATRLLRAARPTLPALWAAHIHVGT
jgi:hypothetical protein